jgi:GNAT superfamily N-acetyltransferase
MTYNIQKCDIDKAARILSQSFINYPIFNYIIPDDAYRKRKLIYIFKFLIRLGLANGEVISTSERIEGVSIWIHSKNNNSSLLTVLQAGLLSLCFCVNFGVLYRLIKVGARKRDTRTKIISELYCQLDMIGVDPLLQRHGYGRRMIEEKLTELDNRKIPCYLETSRIQNVAYYTKLGFELIHEYEIMNIKVFCLLR